MCISPKFSNENRTHNSAFPLTKRSYVQDFLLLFVVLIPWVSKVIRYKSLNPLILLGLRNGAYGIRTRVSEPQTLDFTGFPETKVSFGYQLGYQTYVRFYALPIWNSGIVSNISAFIAFDFLSLL